VQRLGYFAVFLLPALALYGFTQGGAWAWAFVPVLGGLAVAEVTAYLWKARIRAGKLTAVQDTESTE
jgi:hypothetical protein